MHWITESYLDVSEISHTLMLPMVAIDTELELIIVYVTWSRVSLLLR